MSSLHWFTTPTGPHVDSNYCYTHSSSICGAESCAAWGLSVQHTSVCMRNRPAISSFTQIQHINTHKACFRGESGPPSVYTLWLVCGLQQALEHFCVSHDERNQKSRRKTIIGFLQDQQEKLVRKKNCICL